MQILTLNNKPEQDLVLNIVVIAAHNIIAAIVLVTVTVVIVLVIVVIAEHAVAYVPLVKLVLVAADVAVVVAFVGIAIAQLGNAIVQTIVAIVTVVTAKLAKVVIHVQDNLAVLALIKVVVLAVTGEAGVLGLT